MCIGTASIARSTIATAEAIFWRAIVASAMPARITSLDTRSKGVAFARTNWSSVQVSDANILVQEMATTEFWIKVGLHPRIRWSMVCLLQGSDKSGA